MSMMSALGDVKTDIVQNRCVFEKKPVGIGQSMQLACLMKNRQSQARDVVGVHFGIMATPRELHDTAPSQLWEFLDELDPGPIFCDVVGNDAFAQRRLAQRRAVGA